MRFLQKIGCFFIYSNLFIAACAILMARQTFELVLQVQVNGHLIYFIFFATICSYSFHWFLTDQSLIPSARINWTVKNKKLLLVFFFIGLGGAAFFFFFLLKHWFWLMGGSFITFLYTAPKIPHPLFRMLRKVALGKTIFLAMVWTYVTTVLPIVVTEQEWRGDYTLFIAGRFFLIYAICILFDLRDREDDKAAGIRSLITYLTRQGIFILFTTSLLIFTGLTVWLLQYDYSILAVLLLMIPGAITGAIYKYAKTHFNDMLYYFVLDGLMAFSAMLMLVVG